MNTPHITIIAALGARTRAIGKDNNLLWHIPGDLPRVKTLTMGHPLIMGSKTFESIGRPLPGRTTIVITKDPHWTHEGVTVCHSVDEALETARTLDTEEIFIFGGGSIYTQTIEHADRLYLTLVDDDTEGDTFFPDYAHLPFTETAREAHEVDGLRFAYVTLERTTP
jgi:dihydrofolate reductase